jgi:hypothetical protein
MRQLQRQILKMEIFLSMLWFEQWLLINRNQGDVVTVDIFFIVAWGNRCEKMRKLLGYGLWEKVERIHEWVNYYCINYCDRTATSWGVIFVITWHQSLLINGIFHKLTMILLSFIDNPWCESRSSLRTLLVEEWFPWLLCNLGY